MDYCKINNLGKAQDLEKKIDTTKNQIGGLSLVSEFNLDHLIEEVATILHTGRTIAQPTSLTNQAPTTTSVQTIGGKTGELSVVINIDKPNSWKIRSIPGAWRRIVMNLLGNSLKWTQQGLIELSLSEINDADTDSTLTHLRITDTGRGISQDFLKNSAFNPFSQENPLSDGVGLGLSIVHKLVGFLGGHVNVRSEASVGTQVDVYIPSSHREKHTTAANQPPDDTPEMRSDEFSASLIGFNPYPDLSETPTGIMSSEAKRKLSIQSTLASVLMDQLGWRVSLAESLEKGVGDIAVVEHAVFRDIWNGTSFVNMHGNQFKFYIILGGAGLSSSDTFPPNAVFVQQPYVENSLYRRSRSMN